MASSALLCERFRELRTSRLRLARSWPRSHAVSAMPRSTATWAPVIFMRCATKSLAGLRSMTWVLQAIRNGDVPDLVRPLVSLV